MVRRLPWERQTWVRSPLSPWGFFSESSHTSDLKSRSPVTTLLGAWRYRVSAGSGWPGVSTLWLGEIARLICSFYLSVPARTLVWADQSLRYAAMLLGCQANNKQHHLLPCHSRELSSRILFLCTFLFASLPSVVPHFHCLPDSPTHSPAFFHSPLQPEPLPKVGMWLPVRWLNGFVGKHLTNMETLGVAVWKRSRNAELEPWLDVWDR